MHRIEPLLRHLSASGPLSVGVDGALFDDLPGTLAAAGIPARGLYRERVGSFREWDATMPRLVEAVDAATLARLFALVGDRPTGVAWLAPAEQAFRHLRSLNQVVVADRRSRPLDGDRELTEWVTFRHADANVLAQVLPALGPEAFARLLGPAAAILYHPAGDFGADGRWHAAERYDALPAAKAGPLTLDRTTLERIDARRGEVVRVGVRRYLGDNVPPEMAPMTDDELDAVVSDSERSARGLGITGARARREWAWLNLVSDGGFARSERLQQQLRRDDARPDDEIGVLFRHVQAG